MFDKKMLMISIVVLFIFSVGFVSASQNITDDYSLNNQVNVSGNTFEDIQNVIDNADENDTIELNGVYTGTGKEITVNKNLIIHGGSNTTLDGKSKSRIFNINASKVTLMNLNFINAKTATNGGAIYSNGEVIIFNSTFKNNVIEAPDTWDYSISTEIANGGAIHAESMTIDGCSFEDNSVTCNELYSEDTVVGLNVASGGAIYSVTSLILSNSSFSNNFAGEASAICSMGKAKILNCNFTKNKDYVVYKPYTIEAYSETFIYNSDFISNPGGIKTNANINIEKCNFTNNSASAVHSEYYGENDLFINVSDCEFSYNQGDFGGAIDTVNNCLVANCTFIANHGYSGAAICSNDALTVKNSIFVSNNAQIGGAVRCRDADICESLFINNAAGTYYPSFAGGAIYADGVCNVTKSNFTNNSANAAGGIFITPFSDNSKLTVTQCCFDNNAHGAIVSAGSKITVNTNASSLSFSGNVALDNNFNKFTLIKGSTTKLSTTYNSGKTLAVTLKYCDGSPVKRFGVMLKAVKGKTVKYFYAMSNTKGVAVFKVSSLAVGSYSVSVSSDDFYPISKITSSVKISKAKTIVKAPKVKYKYKKSKYFKVTVKNKATKKVVKSIKVKVKVCTGKKHKTYTLKTNKKGVAKLNTKKLKRGSHKVIITSGNSNYKISAKSTIKIK